MALVKINKMYVVSGYKVGTKIRLFVYREKAE